MLPTDSEDRSHTSVLVAPTAVSYAGHGAAYGQYAYSNGTSRLTSPQRATRTGTRTHTFIPPSHRVVRGPPRPPPAPTPKRGDIPITDSDETYAEYEGEAHPLSESYPDFQGSKWRGISRFIMCRTPPH
ncbi:RING finger domain and kelch repeat-containing protein [Frankliniella fusca]|uniref:RING finger domain and kelch repeat-containing protein n=1 Tax=Frankliniella fusca TaxID=407009 RepID=A0AAE1HA86_9NEOP|nr:RING finger domain and kelch repeat-containing protein [Frankliniella fusca]